MNKDYGWYTLDTLLQRFNHLRNIAEDLEAAEQLLAASAHQRRAILVAGNGGSCADAEHIVGELMKKFMRRPPVDTEVVRSLQRVDAMQGLVIGKSLEEAIPAICLSSHSALISAFSNDVDPQMAYAQQVYGYRALSGVFWGISTSGNAQNVVNAAIVAKALNLKVLGMTGEDGGALKGLCDVIIRVPQRETFKVQELHLPVYHWLCARLEWHMMQGSIPT